MTAKTAASEPTTDTSSKRATTKKGPTR
jgi:hypothetical protein